MIMKKRLKKEKRCSIKSIRHNSTKQIFQLTKLTNEAVNRAKEIATSEINKISVIAIKKPEAIAEIQN